jgi:A/G-specific adenine glycosylase
VTCKPRRPACDACPLQSHCVASSDGTQDTIPAPKIVPVRSTVYCAVIVVKGKRGTLVERRPDQGMWPGLWQAPTWERVDRPAPGHEVARWLGVTKVHRTDGFTHETTHRIARFRVWQAAESPPPALGRMFLPAEKIAGLGLSTPQRRILLGTAPAGRR